MHFNPHCSLEDFDLHFSDKMLSPHTFAVVPICWLGWVELGGCRVGGGGGEGVGYIDLEYFCLICLIILSVLPGYEIQVMGILTS